ncbi:MAG TPA: putative baseplate assembly protein, partial [Kofleriaceae bacterium]
MSIPTPPNIAQIGKQPIIDYVTRDYTGFRQGMLDLIPLLLPSWTDRGENDFGVVLIEMFAYVADILAYYQDRVANEAYLATATQRRSVIELLRLIDYQVDPGLAASALLHVDVTADATLAANQLPFRVKTAGIPGQPDRIFELTRPASFALRNNAIVVPDKLTAGSLSMRLPSGSHALGRGDTVYFEETSPGSRMRRTAPLRIIDVRNIGLVNGTSTDQISWLPPLEEAYGDPAHTKLKGNNVAVSHGETIGDEPIYVGDGTPSQAFTLTRKPVTFRLAAPGGRRRRSAPELQVIVDGVPWDMVDSFFGSLSFDTHYTVTVDENDALTVQFGTGQRGAIVPAGAQVKAIYRVGLGQSGNVGPDTIKVAVSSVAAVKAVSNPFHAAGGADRESDAEAKISGPGSVISQDRAVTLQDYELLAKAFPGVGKAHARVGLRGGFKVVQVYIVPEDSTGVMPPPLPSADLKDAVKRELESRMPVNRMAGVDVLDPTYVGIDITVEVHLKGDASSSAARGDVQTALGTLLSFAQVDFGSAVRVGDIYATLFPITGVSFTQLRRLARSGQPQT